MASTEEQRAYWREQHRKYKNKSLEHYYLHRKETQAKQLVYKRMHRLHSGGKEYYGVNKAPRPEGDICPVCEEALLKLHWHHWDDSNLDDGLWICSSCHSSLGHILHKIRQKPRLLDLIIQRGPQPS